MRDEGQANASMGLTLRMDDVRSKRGGGPWSAAAATQSSARPRSISAGLMRTRAAADACEGGAGR